MNILVTGGCGFIGSHLCELLVNLGHTVTVLDKLTYAANVKFADEMIANSGGKYRLIVDDVANTDLVLAVLREFNPDLVMHLAAESHVDRSILSPQLFLDANVKGTYSLLEAIREWKPSNPFFRLLHVSTDEVFGDMPLGSLHKFDENSPYRPSNPYSASKAAADWLVRAWGRTYGIPWIITHGANAYGPRQLPDKLIPMAIVNSLREWPVTIHGTGSNQRSWVYVVDHARALFAAAMHGSPFNSYCFDAGCEISNLDIATTIVRTVAQMTGKTAVIKHVADRPGNDLRYGLSASKLEREAGWVPLTPFNEGLEVTINWYVKEYANV